MSSRAAWRLESLGFEEVYEYAAGLQDWITSGLPTEGTALAETRAGELARADVPTCRLDEPLAEVRERTRAAGFETCVVVNEEGVVFGLIRSRDLEGDAPTAGEAMRPGPSTFRPNVGAADLGELMARHELPDIPITTNDGRLVGLLLREDAERVAGERHDHDHG